MTRQGVKGAGRSGRNDNGSRNIPLILATTEALSAVESREAAGSALEPSAMAIAGSVETGGLADWPTARPGNLSLGRTFWGHSPLGAWPLCAGVCVCVCMCLECCVLYGV